MEETFGPVVGIQKVRLLSNPYVSIDTHDILLDRFLPTKRLLSS